MEEVRSGNGALMTRFAPLLTPLPLHLIHTIGGSGSGSSSSGGKRTVPIPPPNPCKLSFPIPFWFQLLRTQSLSLAIMALGLVGWTYEVLLKIREVSVQCKHFVHVFSQGFFKKREPIFSWSCFHLLYILHSKLKRKVACITLYLPTVFIQPVYWYYLYQ